MLQMMDSRAAAGWRTMLSTRTGFWLAVGAVLCASIPMRFAGATPDVSWLTSMCERMLDGEKGWIDIFETTPPIPTLLYMPGALLARLLGVSSEAPVFATAYVAALLSLAITDRILPARIDDTPSRWSVAFPAAVFLFLLSNDAFAQREWFAAAFSLPMFAAFARNAEEGSWPPLFERLLAATLAGLAFAIKPPIFALPFIAIAGWEWFRTRSLSFFLPSMLPVAAAAGLLMTAASLAAFPAYLGGVATLMREVYVPIRLGPQYGLVNEAFIATALAALVSVLIMRRTKKRAAASIANALMAGYALAYFLQGKYFDYHFLPAAFFGLTALMILLWSRTADLLRHRPHPVPLITCAVAAISVPVLLFASFDDRRAQMRDLTWAENMHRPTAMAVCPDISLGFPLSQHVGARWVDRIHGQWIARYTRIWLERAKLSPAEREKFQRYHDGEIARTARVIREKKPELIFQCPLAGEAWLTEELLAHDPTVLDDYEEIAEEGVFRILRRRAGG